MPLSSSLLPSGIAAVATSPLCVNLSCEGLFYTNPFCGVFLWDLHVPVAMYCKCTAVAWGNMFPSLWDGRVNCSLVPPCRWLWMCHDRGVSACGAALTEQGRSRCVVLGELFRHYFGKHLSLELPSALVMSEVTGWAVWFDVEGSEASTLVSAKKCNRGTISAWIFRGEIIPAPISTCFGEVFGSTSF